MSAPLWQHLVAITAALLASGWLVRRAVKGGSKGTGPCASCPASRSRAVNARGRAPLPPQPRTNVRAGMRERM